jgi:hypothetical protein
MTPPWWKRLRQGTAESVWSGRWFPADAAVRCLTEAIAWPVSAHRLADYADDAAIDDPLRDEWYSSRGSDRTAVCCTAGCTDCTHRGQTLAEESLPSRTDVTSRSPVRLDVVP